MLLFLHSDFVLKISLHVSHSEEVGELGGESPAWGAPMRRKIQKFYRLLLLHFLISDVFGFG